VFSTGVGPGGGGKENDLSKIWFDAWKIGILCIKKKYIHLDCSNVLCFLSPLSIETLSQDTDTSEKDLRNMPSLWLLPAGSLALCIKDLRIKLKGKSTGQLKLTKPIYTKGFLRRGKHFS